MIMLKSLLRRFWSVRYQFFRYFCVGFSAFILDMGSLMFFKEILKATPVVAVIINQAVLLVYVFCLNKYWSFRNHDLPHRQVARFLILSGTNYLVAVMAMYLFSQRLNFDYRLVRIGNIILAVSWNFVLYKVWVYKTKTPFAENPPALIPNV